MVACRPAASADHGEGRRRCRPRAGACCMAASRSVAASPRSTRDDRPVAIRLLGHRRADAAGKVDEGEERPDRGEPLAAPTVSSVARTTPPCISRRSGRRERRRRRRPSRRTSRGSRRRAARPARAGRSSAGSRAAASSGRSERARRRRGPRGSRSSTPGGAPASALDACGAPGTFAGRGVTTSRHAGRRPGATRRSTPGASAGSGIRGDRCRVDRAGGQPAGGGRDRARIRPREGDAVGGDLGDGGAEVVGRREPARRPSRRSRPRRPRRRRASDGGARDGPGDLAAGHGRAP